ncbi:MAG TPA: hypothetical protein VK530_18900, partial [Candidatus Acidoferrum sp.]|nr:hypothetical protein [Candidatus Acidoferrum sp.]
YSYEMPQSFAGFERPITYQWRRDGTNVTGATNASLPFVAPTSEANGWYDVVVSDRYTSATSHMAQVEIVAPELAANRDGALIELSFRGVAEVAYSAQQRDSFDPADGWSTTTIFFGNASVTRWSVPILPSVSNRFYRVVTEP